MTYSTNKNSAISLQAYNNQLIDRAKNHPNTKNLKAINQESTYTQHLREIGKAITSLSNLPTGFSNPTAKEIANRCVEDNPITGKKSYEETLEKRGETFLSFLQEGKLTITYPVCYGFARQSGYDNLKNNNPNFNLLLKLSNQLKDAKPDTQKTI